jgi:hypothetical protein
MPSQVISQVEIDNALWAATPTIALNHGLVAIIGARLVALNGSPGRLEFSEALFGIDSTLDGSIILFKNIIQVLTGRCRQRLRSVPSFLLLGIAELSIGLGQC